MRRRVDIEPDDVLKFAGELRIVRQLELAHPVRLQAVAAPDALHRADADAGRRRHHGGGPVGRRGGWVGQSESDDTLVHRGTERRDTRAPRLIAQQAVITLLGEAFLPAPHAGLRLAGPAHDLVGAEPIGAEQDNLRPPHMLLCGVAISREHLQSATVGTTNVDDDTWTHRPDSHIPSPAGIPSGIQMSDFIH